jgi:hypothetical protein
VSEWDRQAFMDATEHAQAALEAAQRLPHGPYRRCVMDDLKAAVGWLKQAHDEWAQRKAGQ